MPHKPRLVTGLQSSGQLHLGSYLGTITHWESLAQSHDCYFFIADLHAITVRQDPSVFYQNTLDCAAMLMATGMDLEKQCLFLQSHVPEHSELGWIFSCLTPMGELNRMTQFKEKSQTHKHTSGLGLYAYPCLMAADILLYNPSDVPVGADQKQHLELARNIAERFNRDFGETFTIPNPYITGPASRVMALQHPENKMSKSDPHGNNTIFLLDQDTVILKKIKRAVTDSIGIVADDASRPGIANLVRIFAQLTGQSTDQVAMNYQQKGYGVFKNDLAEVIIQTLKPIQDRYARIRDDQAELEKKLYAGAKKASASAKHTLYHVKKRMGFSTHG